jgi:uncharacterized protein
VAGRTAPRRKSETVALTGERLRFVVVADTHGEPHPRAHELIARERPERILHAGDIGDLRVIRELEAIAPTSAVRGNIDARTPGVPDILRLDVTDGDARLFGLLLLHIAVAGPKLRADAIRLAHEEDAAIVVCGHSHVPFIGRDRALTIFNPGSIGPRRFHLPIVFGVMDISRERVSMKHVSCETGEVWLP